MPEYFTLDEVRGLPDVDQILDYPEERVEAAAAYIVSVIEREVGTSFVPRTVTAEVHDGGTTGVTLSRGYVTSVTSATIGGVAVTDTLLAERGVLYRFATGTTAPLAWPAGTGNITVTYQAGYSTVPPADVKEMALKGTRAHLLANAEASSINDRRTSISTDMGQINYVVAGENRPTGYPEVDAMILGWKARLDVLGFA